jgi:hypothetical protein
VVGVVVEYDGPIGALSACTVVFSGILIVSNFVVLNPGSGRATVTFTVPLWAVPLGVVTENA